MSQELGRTLGPHDGGKMSKRWKQRVSSATPNGQGPRRTGVDHAVQAILEPVQAFLISGAITREGGHALLNACFDLKALAGADEIAEDAARKVGAALLCGALGWTEPLSSEFDTDWETLADDAALWRLEFLYRLHRTPNLIPAPLRDQFTATFIALNEGDGSIPKLLQPVRPSGRGQNPTAARGLEELLWCWIHWQHAEGKKISDLVAEVAAAACVTTKAVERWRSSWIERDGAAEVNEAFVSFTDASYGRDFFRDYPGMRELVRQWRVARTPQKAATRKST